MFPTKLYTRWFFILGLTVVLPSCGGGSSSNSSSGGGGAQPPAAAVIIDPAIPAVTTRQISQIVSPLGAFPVGTTPDMPAVTGDAEIILTVDDASHNIVLARLVSASDTGAPMTATSTALAFCRLMQGPLPSGVTGAQVDAAITSAAEFPHLVSLLNNDYTAGTLPQDDPAVITSMSLVLSQAMPTLATHATVSRVVATMAASLANPSVTIPPYTVLSGGALDVFTIKVTGADSAVKGVDITNGFPIQFAAYGSLADGSAAPIPTGSATDDGYVQLPLTKLYQTASSTPVPGNGQEWNLTVLQSDASREANGIKLGTDMVNTGLSFANLGDIAPECITSLTSVVLERGTDKAWAKAANAESGWGQFTERLSTGSDWTEIGKGIYSCAKSGFSLLPQSGQNRINSVIGHLTDTEFAQKIAPHLQSLANFFGKIAKAQTVYDIVNTGTEGWAYWNYWNYSATVGVCESTIAGATKIGNCAASLTLTPGVASGVVGDKTSFSAMALDSAGQPTLTPQGLKWTSSNPAIATVDATTGTVTAVAASLSAATITATDSVTGATGSALYTVSGVSATLGVTPGSIALGGAATLSWSSAHATSCTASGAWSGTLATSGSKQVSPVKTGTYQYTIKCNGPGGPATSAATLTVVAPPSGGGSVYKYAGNDFSPSSPYAGETFLPGHILFSVKFKDDLSHYTGGFRVDDAPASPNDKIVSLNATVDNGAYRIDYPSQAICGKIMTFNFENGVITSWYIYIISCQSADGQWGEFNSHNYTVVGPVMDDVHFKDSAHVMHRGANAASPGHWTLVK